MTKETAWIEIPVKKGATLTFLMTRKNKETGEPIAMSGITAVMEIKEHYSSPAAILRLTTENSGISLGASNGQIIISMTSAQTNLIKKKCIYDLVLINGSNIDRFAEGDITLDIGVTQV